MLRFPFNVKRLDIKAAARRDLADIRDFSIERFGGSVAAGYLASFEVVFRRIIEFPEIGAVSAETKALTYLYAYRSHRIFYRVTKTDIIIVRILHKARDASALLN